MTIVQASSQCCYANQIAEISLPAAKSLVLRNLCLRFATFARFDPADGESGAGCDKSVTGHGQTPPI